MSDIKTTVTRVLAEHPLNRMSMRCRCGWLASDGLSYDRGIDAHRNHVAAKVAEALAGPAPETALAPLVLRNCDCMTSCDCPEVASDA